MRMSIVAVAVLGGSAACASAQNGPASFHEGAGAGAIQEAVCGPECLAELQLVARSEAVPAAPSIFMRESALENAGGVEREREQQAAYTVRRQYNVDYTALTEVGDPFQGGLSAQSAPRGMRADDSEGFEGRFANFSAGGKWRKGDVDGSQSGRAWGMTVGVNLGPLNIRAAHQNRNVAKVTRYDQVDITMAARNSIVAANMRFDWGTAYTAYSANRGWGNSPLFNPDNPYGASVAATRSTDSRDVLMGVAVPVSRQTTVLASYVRRNDRDPANNDARQLAVGATYAVSRRMDFYAAYSHVQHLAGEHLGIKPGNGSSLNVGMRRAF